MLIVGWLLGGTVGVATVLFAAFIGPLVKPALHAWRSPRRRLAQQGAGGLLEDPAPGAGLLALGGEVADDLAHARGGDLDAVAAADLADLVVVLGELQRHRLEAVAGDVDARGEVEDVRLEHQLVVGVGLDQDDVDARVALLPVAGHLVQALVGEQLERLVADLREAHVRDAPDAGAEQRRDRLREVVDVRAPAG